MCFFCYLCMQNQTNNMMKKLRIIAAVAAFVVTGSVAEAQIAAPEHLNDTHTMLRVTPTARYLLLPVEEKRGECTCRCASEQSRGERP